MNVPDRRRTQRLALVPPTPIITLVLAPRSVIHRSPLTRAVIPTPPQLGVQRIQRVGVELADLDLPDERQHVQPRIAPIVRLRRRLTIEMLIQVPLQQLLDRRLRPRTPPLIHLVQQTSANAFGFGECLGTWGHDLDESMPLLGHRIKTGRDPDT
ncbi:hypothetical protein GCM10027444_26090 [Actinopolyspora lacussalsi]